MVTGGQGLSHYGVSSPYDLTNRYFQTRPATFARNCRFFPHMNRPRKRSYIRYQGLTTPISYISNPIQIRLDVCHAANKVRPYSPGYDRKRNNWRTSSSCCQFNGTGVTFLLVHNIIVRNEQILALRDGSRHGTDQSSISASFEAKKASLKN